ncbi:MAG TPA: integrase core domain-containing protein [Mycobacterium sp.]|jgi:putative transposase|nr:integrase core domain-containing protein [Mycobacterium sp.]
MLYDPDRVGGLHATHGLSGARPNAPGPQGDVEGTDGSDNDRLALLAVNDVQTFWAATYPQFFSGPYTPVSTADGRTIKMLNVIDEYTREALAIEVDRSIDADGVVDVLNRLALTHGAPYYVRFDNGPEFVAHAVSDWCRFNSAGSLFIDPGSPWQNAWIESFNGRLRDELLNSWRFDSLLEARVIIEDWRCDYNANRPHSAHGELTPAEFAQQWTTTHQPQAA